MKKTSLKLVKVLTLVIVAVCFVSADVIVAEDIDYIKGRPLTEEEIAEQKAMLPEPMPVLEIEGFDGPVKTDSGDSGIETYGLLRSSSLPTKYDMREKAGYASKVTVENQGSSGLCWAFATTTVAEIAYYHDNPSAQAVQLSPKRLGYFFYNRINDPLKNTANDKNVIKNGKDYLNVGGNCAWSFQALANWGGLAKESVPFDDDYESYSEGLAYENDLILENAELFDRAGDTYTQAEMEAIKQEILDEGAVTASINTHYLQYFDQYYNADTAAYNCKVPKVGTDHAVTIVGWDDNYDVNNFLDTAKPNNNGAWIVQNSWGADTFGDKGYFYVSYEDTSISNMVSFDMQPADTYDYCYQYDGNSYPAYYKYNDGYLKVGDRAANVYTVPADKPSQQLEAVGFTTWNIGTTQYTVDIYTGVNGTNPVSGQKVYSSSDILTADTAGYHTFKLNSPVVLAPGTKYSIVVNMKTNGTAFGVEAAGTATENQVTAIEFQCEHAVGQSYIYRDGSWRDLHNSNMTARIKGFTSVVEGGSTEQPVTPPADPETASDRIFKGSKSVRYGGADRYETALKIANAYKTANNISQFDVVIVACGSNYPDALAGSYLAEVKNAPILLVGKNTSSEAQIRNYIKENLKSKGQVYLLGGTAVVSSRFETSLKNAEYKVTRLGGSTRYDTNLQILKAAGVTNQDILICTGNGYADSLSASAVGKPIMIVGNKLTSQQKSYLAGLSGDRFYLIGGSSVVNNTVGNQLKSYGSVSRVWGATRYETSTAVAKKFFNAGDTDAAVLAYAQNFPDGLSGGPLALSLDGPLILTNNSNASVAGKCVRDLGIKHVAVLGGSGLISNGTVNNILN